MAAASIVEEIFLEEILLHLPVQSLVRFKCVSKRWRSQISDPCFSRSHTLRHFTPFPTSLIQSHVRDGHNHFHITPSSSSSSSSSSNSNSDLSFAPFITDFQFLNPDMDFILMRSSNGLVLVQGRFSPPYLYFVCNPVTKQFLPIHLPPDSSLYHSSSSSLDIDSLRTQDLHLAFEPLRSSHFTLILIRFNPIEIHLYSSNTGSWTHLVGISIPEETIINADDGVYCNGAIYWHCPDRESVYFDVANRCFKSFPMPNYPHFRSHLVERFGVSGGRLYLILGLGHRTDERLLYDIFELKEDLSEWSFMSRVDLLRRSLGDRHRIQCYFRQKNKQDSILVFSNGGQVILCNISDCTISRVVDFNCKTLVLDLQYSASLSWDGDSSAL